MIALLRGKIISQDQNMAILDVNGVGYQVYLSGAALERAKGSTEQITLHTHMHVKEDGIDLYGFATIDEKSCFRRLSQSPAWAARQPSTS